MRTQPRPKRRFRSLAILAATYAVVAGHPHVVHADRPPTVAASSTQDIWQDMTPADLPPPVVTPASPPPKPAVCDNEAARKLCLANATIIVEVGQSMGFEKRALIIAVATAMQESDLHNLGTKVHPVTINDPSLGSEGHGEDRDSVGLFQQRPSQNWGTATQLMNRRFAAEQFYKALRRLTTADFRATTELWESAYRVQVCARQYRREYQKHEPMATAVVDYVVALQTVRLGASPVAPLLSLNLYNTKERGGHDGRPFLVLGYNPM